MLIILVIIVFKGHFKGKGHVGTSTPFLCHSQMICQASLWKFLKTFQHLFRYGKETLCKTLSVPRENTL